MAEQTAAAPKARPSWLKPLEHPLVVLGELSMFAGQSATSIFRRPYRVGLLMVQLEFMAYGSMFVVGLTGDRKSTRLNSSHGYISYAVFCLKKKKSVQTRVCEITRDSEDTSTH